MSSIEASYFDGLYERSPDPWNFTASPYERAKFAHTARALGPTGSLLEIGCANGELAAVLAAQSQSVLAIDFSPRAIGLARTRLAGLAGVEVAWGHFPAHMPPGSWDAIVCSEVLYFLDRPALEDAAAHLERALSRGARVILVHWRLPAPTNPLQGDEVHDLLCERLLRWHVLDERRSRYRMDLFHA